MEGGKGEREGGEGEMEGGEKHHDHLSKVCSG